MRNPNARVRNPADYKTFPGSPIHDILEARFNGETTRLVKVGEENIQDKIEAEAPFTDINFMLHRLSLGDTSVVSTRQAMYGDFSQLPSDPIEAINLVHNSESAFAQLPADVRQRYNNDWKVWLADILSGNVSRETESKSESKSETKPETKPETEVVLDGE